MYRPSMRSRLSVILVILCGSWLVMSLGCSGMQSLFSTPTPTPTNTPTPTPTNTPTPTPTNTPTPTPTNTPTPIYLSIPSGWREHTVSGFHLLLPEQWEVVDIDKEGIHALLNLLEGLNTPWAQSVSAMFSAESIQKMIKLWAMDTKPAGAGYASINVMFQSVPFIVESEDLCIQIPSVYQQTGITLLDSECGLEINGLDVGRFEARVQVGTLAVRQYQYIYVQNRKMWTLTLAVDETQWSKYTSIFATIAESFRVD